MSIARERETGDMTKKFIFDISEYESPSSRIKGFQAIEELGLNRPRPMLVLGHNAFEEYKRVGLTLTLQEAIFDAFSQIREQNPKRGAYIGRAFYVPGIEAPNGPRTAAIRDKSEYMNEVQKFWHFVRENNYDIEGADIALILHPFIDVMDPPRTKYANLKLSVEESLPYSAGSVYPAPLPGIPGRVMIRTLFGPDEAIQHCPQDVFYVDSDTETVIEKKIAYKDKTFIPRGGNNYVLAEVPKGFRSKQSLTDSEAISIAQWARNLNDVRAEFIVQDDGIFFREIAPYDPSQEYELYDLMEGEEIIGPVIRISKIEDVAKIRYEGSIVYFSRSAFQERTTDIFKRVSDQSNSKITALSFGYFETNHPVRIIRDRILPERKRHNLIFVGDREFEDNDWVKISLDVTGKPEVCYQRPFTRAIVNAADTKQLRNGEAGNKLARLSVLAEAGIPVPNGFVIKSNAIWEHLKNIGVITYIDKLASIKRNQQGGITSISDSIRNTIITSSLSGDFKEQLDKAIAECSCERFVVRSSGDEDGKDKSSAGLFESHTNVLPDEVESRIMETVASYFSPTAILDRQRNEQNPLNVSIGVGIQEYIFDPNDSNQMGGTAFTYPEKIVFEIAKGTAESVVNGQAETQVVFNRKTGMAESRPEKYNHDIIQKFEKIQPKLQEYIREIELMFSDYQDIEWVYNQKHGLVIVQARPL